ncbi:hypothetical protein ADUPG1_012923 [Aduncisulcus paluster]|uniref:Uncharacterized protein n=1 Tax=Aduncisulcus paluster TaxID=2918883 RepID=A0ABQ5K154_9EUKA|nr:hypothetical protein ADUPG1_012923 [Aduncisulcus paluster]
MNTGKDSQERGKKVYSKSATITKKSKSPEEYVVNGPDEEKKVFVLLDTGCSMSVANSERIPDSFLKKTLTMPRLEDLEGDKWSEFMANFEHYVSLGGSKKWTELVDLTVLDIIKDLSEICEHWDDILTALKLFKEPSPSVKFCISFLKNEGYKTFAKTLKDDFIPLGIKAIKASELFAPSISDFEERILERIERYIAEFEELSERYPGIKLPVLTRIIEPAAIITIYDGLQIKRLAPKYDGDRAMVLDFIDLIKDQFDYDLLLPMDQELQRSLASHTKKLDSQTSVKMLLEHVLGECKVAYFHMRSTKGDRIMVRCEECKYHILTLGGCSNAARGCCQRWCPNPLMVTRIGEHSQECRFQFVHADHECECSTSSIEIEERK